MDATSPYMREPGTSAAVGGVSLRKKLLPACPRAWLVRSLLFTTTCAATLLAVSTPLSAHGSSCKLVTVDSPTLVIDPYCNTCDGGEVDLLLRNDNSNPVDLLITINDVINTETHKAEWHQLSWHTADPISAAQLSTIQPGKFARLVVELSGLRSDGEWEAHVKNWGTEIGSFHAVRHHFPVGVSIDLPNPDRPTITVTKSAGAVIPIKNQDGTSYSISWSLIADGVSQQSPTGFLPAAVTTPITVLPNQEWFGWSGMIPWVDHIVKGNRIEGQLEARLRADSCGPTKLCEPSKVFPVTLIIATYVPSIADWLRGSVILCVLVTGAVASLFLNAFLPNQSKRKNLKSSLKSLKNDIRGLPMELSSRLRVLAGVEQKRLLDNLNAIWSVDSDFPRLADETGKGVEQLKTRIIFMQQMGQLRTQFEALARQVLVPTILEDIEERFENAIEELGQIQFTDSGADSVQIILKNIEELLKRLCTIRSLGDDAILQQGFQSRADDLKRILLPAASQGNAVSLPNGPSTTLLAQVTPLIDELKSLDLATIHPREFAHTDQILYKLDLVCQVLDAEILQSGSLSAESIAKQEQAFIHEIRQTSWSSFKWARIKANEMASGHFKEDILTAIATDLERFSSSDRRRVWIGALRIAEWAQSLVNRVTTTASHVPQETEQELWQTHEVAIDTSSSQPLKFEAVRLKVRFANEHLDSALAKDEFLPVWDFGHDRLTPERGWEVMHYFPKTGRYTISIAFEDRSRGVVRSSDGQTIYLAQDFVVKDEPKPKFSILKPGVSLGVAKLAIALIPVLLALYSGASEQLSKLDLIPGMAAVFLLGFSSDQVKNLLSKQ